MHVHNKLLHLLFAEIVSENWFLKPYRKEAALHAAIPYHYQGAKLENKFNA